MSRPETHQVGTRPRVTAARGRATAPHEIGTLFRFAGLVIDRRDRVASFSPPGGLRIALVPASSEEAAETYRRGAGPPTRSRSVKWLLEQTEAAAPLAFRPVYSRVRNARRDPSAREKSLLALMWPQTAVVSNSREREEEASTTVRFVPLCARSRSAGALEHPTLGHTALAELARTSLGVPDADLAWHLVEALR